MGKRQFSWETPCEALYKRQSYLFSGKTLRQQKNTLHQPHTMTRTLVIPLVSMGSVPQYTVQLAVDSQLPQLTKQNIDSLFMYPFTSSNLAISEIISGDRASPADKPHALTTPLELYVNKDGVMDFVQLHSPIIPGCESLFVKQILKLINESYTNLIVLDSKDKGLWHGDATDEGVLHWANKTLSKIQLDDKKAKEQFVELENVAETSPIVSLFLENLDISVNDLCIDYYAVNVYDGWNWPAVGSLLAAIGVEADVPSQIGETSVAVEGVYS